MTRFLTSIALTLLLLPCRGAAQGLDTLTLEDRRVRVIARCEFPTSLAADCRRDLRPRIADGRLRALDRDTLRVRAEGVGRDLVIPTALVERVWVVDGKRGNFWAGAGVGLVAGGALGAVIGSQVDFCILTCSPATEFGFIIGAPAGFVLGGIIGAVIKSDRWREVPVNRRSVSVVPRPGGVSVMVSGEF